MTPASISPADQAAKLNERKEKQAEILRARHKLALAWAEVFGVEASRTERQRAVWKNLEDVCCLRSTTAMQQQAGNVDANMTLILEGRRQIGLHILSMLEEADSPPPA